MARSLGRGVREFQDTVGTTHRDLETGVMEPVEAVRDTVDIAKMQALDELRGSKLSM